MNRELASRLIPYVPMDRLHAEAAGMDLPRRTQGSVLLADISGFTPLTEAYERELGARRGSEELTRHLNAAYRALIGEVHRFRGSVIGFSGDALTCWFDGDDGLLAATCGARMQRAIAAGGEALARAEGHPSLAIKVAVTNGSARRFRVGEPQRQVLDVLTGDVAIRAAEAEAHAAPGDLVVGPEVLAALAGRVVLAAQRRDAGADAFMIIRELEEASEPLAWPPLALEAMKEEALRPWLLPPVYERLRRGHGEYLAELRQATALFVRFQGLDFDRDERLEEKLDAYVRWVQAVVERYEGSLLQLTTGDKGSYLYIAFGVPVAHEDAVERTLEAALVLRAPPPHLGFITRTQLGVSLGPMRCGAYGSEDRRTYGALGDETNVAARLMMKAKPSEIVVSERIARHAAGAGYAFESLGAAELKGKGVMPLFALTGRSLRRTSARLRVAPKRPRAGSSRGTMVGRAAERTTLHEALDALRHEHRGGVILIEGEAGQGKSRLLRDVLEHAASAEGSPVRTLVAMAEAVEQQTSYYAWRSVFLRLLGIDPLAKAEAIAARVLAQLPPELAPLSPLLDPVLEIDLPETPESAAFPPSMRAAGILAYLARVLRALLGDQPVLLVVEDAHWLDSASWALLETVRRELPRLLLVVTTRPTPVRSEPYERLREEGGRHHHLLRLQPLSSRESSELLGEVLGVPQLPPAVLAFVRDKAEGNPFFTEQLALALRDLGLVRVEGETCHVADELETLRFPDTIQGVVTSRIDRLLPAQQLTLKVASVVGRAFSRSTLEDIFPVDRERDHVPGLLEELTRLGLMSEDCPEPDASYVFRHAVTREVAYDLMLFEQRRALHETLADWYERVHAGDLRPFFAVVAHHREKALVGLPKGTALSPVEETRVCRAARALARAARQALQSGASAEAVTQVRRALPLLESLPASRERSEIELDAQCVLGAGLVAMKAPGASEVRQAFERARELCLELGAVARLFEVVFGLWYTRFNASDRGPALALSGELLAIARRAEVATFHVLACQAAGATALADGEHEQALVHINAGIAMAERDTERDGRRGNESALSQARDPVALSHCFRAWAHCYLGHVDRGVRDVETAMALSRELSHPLTLTQTLTYAALVRKCRREPVEAEALVGRALTLARENGFAHWIVIGTSVEGWIALERGKLVDCVEQVREGLRAGREDGFVPIVTISMMADLLDALTRLGRLEEAQAVLAETKGVFDRQLMAFHAAEIHRLEGALWLRTGDVRRAIRCTKRAVEVARSQKAQLLELRAALALVRLVPDDPASLQALRRVYGTFPEGRGIPDMLEAGALLEGRTSTEAREREESAERTHGVLT